MNKIALPIENGFLCSCFEQSTQFIIFTTEEHKITAENLLITPQFQAGLFPIWLFDNGVTDVLVNRINHETINKFNQLKINVFVGVETKHPGSLIDEFLRGNLETHPEFCIH